MWEARPEATSTGSWEAAMATGAGRAAEHKPCQQGRGVVWAPGQHPSLGKERTGSDPGFLLQTRAGTGLACRGIVEWSRGARPPCRGQGCGLQRGRSLRTPSKLN